MSKRGMLLASEVLKIVLGLIGIALLVYLLASLYFSNVDQKRLVQAESTLDILSGHINNFQYNSSYVGKIDLVTPWKWTIFSYVGSELKPNQCAFENCICICEDVNEEFLFGIIVLDDRQEKECSEDGACLIVKNLDEFADIYIGRDPPLNLMITKEGGLVKVRKI